MTAKGLATDVGGRIAAMRARGDSDSSREERIAEWGELIFRSILGTGGRMVLEDAQDLPRREAGRRGGADL